MSQKMQIISPERAEGFIDLSMVINPFPWSTFDTPCSMHPVNLQQGTQTPINWSLTYIHSSHPSSLTPTSSLRNPVDTLPRLSKSGTIIGGLPDPIMGSTARFCLWWLQLQTHRDLLPVREAIAKAQVSPFCDTISTSASAEEKARYDKQRDVDVTNAFKRYPGFEFRLSLSMLFLLAAGIMRPNALWGRTDLNIVQMDDGPYRSLFALCNAGVGKDRRRILIFVAKDGICLDLAHGTVILDTAVLVITKELRKILPPFFTGGDDKSKDTIYSHDVMSDAMRTWEEVLPAYAERCRGQAWEHGPACEYKKWQRVPVATKAQNGDAVFCSCSMGKLPGSWSLDDHLFIPLWSELRPHLVRAAITLPFGCAGLGEMYHHPLSWDPLLYPRASQATHAPSGPTVVGNAVGTGPSAVAGSAAGPARAPPSTAVQGPTNSSQLPPAQRAQTKPTCSAPIPVPSGVSVSASAPAPAPAPAPASTGARPIARATGARRPASTSASATAKTTASARLASPAALQEAKSFLAKHNEAQAQAKALKASAANLAMRPKESATSSQPPVQAPAPVSTKSASTNAPVVPAAAPTKPVAGYRCTFCGESKNRVNGGELNKCSKCQRARYCSKECQMIDWKRHKKECAVGGVGAGAGAGASNVAGQKDKGKGKEKADGK